MQSVSVVLVVLCLGGSFPFGMCGHGERFSLSYVDAVKGVGVNVHLSGMCVDIGNIFSVMCKCSKRVSKC